MLSKQNIFLIGPMGSGKTAVGRALARKLNRDFYDSDAEVEARTGVDVPYVFEKEGETGFRQREREALEQLTLLEPIVLATGGGAILDPDNRRVLKERGCVVYLETSVEQQLERTRHSHHRPLLRDTDPEARLRQLISVREPLYREVADIVVVTDSRRVPAVVEEILRAAGAMGKLHAVQPLTIDLGDRSYPIFIGSTLLARRELFEAHLQARSALIVTNETVGPLYLPALKQGLAGFKTSVLTLKDGEQYKTLDTLRAVLDGLVESRLNRDGAVIALGGGVIGDIAGFAAACYQRGIACVQVPTTLLSQVDSSVGGKTGVNHPGGKNLIGAFHQPSCVVSDISTLDTLPVRELRAGLAEVIKYGLICDPGFFNWLEESMDALLARDPAALTRAIRRSCEIKAQIVSEDEREQSGRRALLNLGHTFGHAIEAATGFSQWLHGEAVGVGMLIAADLSSRLGRMDTSQVELVRRLLQQAGLPVAAPRIGAARAAELMSLDKKVMASRIRLVLLAGIGAAYLTADYDPAVLQQTLVEHFGE